MSETDTGGDGTSKKRIMLKQKLQTVGIYGFVYGMAFLFLVPYIYMVSVSFRGPETTYTTTPQWIPPNPSLHWFNEILASSEINRWIINTVIIATAGTLLVIVVDSLIAFSLTKMDWPGKKAIFSLILLSFLVPYYVNIIPLYNIMVNFGLLNQLLAVILPIGAGPIGVFLLVQFFRDIPDELIEAAKVDGLSTFQIYSRIILPVAKPAISSLGIFIFVWSWNQYLWPLVILTDSSKFNLAVGLPTVLDQYGLNPSLFMAMAFIAAAPLFIVYLLLQKQIVEAVKMQGTVG